MSLRVFAPDGTALVEGIELVLDPIESHYLARVRRATVGQVIEVLDGVCVAHFATVLEVDPRSSRIRLAAPVECPSPPPLELGLGLPAPSAALDAITFACEVGATRIDLLQCARSHASAPSPTRITKVVRAALRQSGRPCPPRMHGPVALSRWLAEPTELTGFVAWAKLRDRSNAPQTRTSPGARLLVGPEGGLTDDEAAAAIAAGLRPISLGPWTLRTETAVIAGLSRLVHREA